MIRDGHLQWPSPLRVVQSFRGSESRCRLIPRAHHLRGTAGPQVESESPSPDHSFAPKSRTESCRHQPRTFESYLLLAARQALLIPSRKELPQESQQTQPTNFNLYGVQV